MHLHLASVVFITGLHVFFLGLCNCLLLLVSRVADSENGMGKALDLCQQEVAVIEIYNTITWSSITTISILFFSTNSCHFLFWKRASSYHFLRLTSAFSFWKTSRTTKRQLLWGDFHPIIMNIQTKFWWDPLNSYVWVHCNQDVNFQEDRNISLLSRVKMENTSTRISLLDMTKIWTKFILLCCII